MLSLYKKAEDARIGSISILNIMKTKASPKGEAIKAKAVTMLQPEKTLKYVVVNINGVSFKALIDFEANQCLVAENFARIFGLTHSKELGWVKVVDQLPYVIYGVTHSVPIEIEMWQGKVDLNIMLMSDFQLVLGDKFIDQMLPFIFTDDGCMKFKYARRCIRYWLSGFKSK